MVDCRTTKFAKVLVNYSMKIKKGDLLIIDCTMLGEPLAKEVYREALAAGANVMIQAGFDGIGEILLKNGSDEQLQYINPITKLAYEKADAMLTIMGGYNTKSLSNIDPARLSLRSRSQGEVMKLFMDRIGKKELRWCGTQFPTHASAMDGNMSLAEYEEFLLDACHLNSEDPVAEWKKVHEQQQKYVDYLNTKSTIEVKSKDTNLTLSTKGRKWVNCDGQVNFPDGEIFTSPVEDSMNGTVRFSFPAIYMNREVEDVVLTFKDGKVVDAKATKGEDFLKEVLNIDEGASLVGEFAIGTNYNIKKFTKNILFDEKLGGTIHIAIGASIKETGGVNDSSIHWDLISDMKDGGEIYADGELFYKDGKFLI